MKTRAICWITCLALLLLSFSLPCNFVTAQEYTSDGIAAAPVITTHLPPRGSLANPPNSAITVTFDQTIDPVTVSKATFISYGSMSPVFNGSYVISTGDEIASFTPLRSYFPGEDIYTTITTGIANPGNEHLAKPMVWQFQAAVSPSSAVFYDTGQQIDKNVAATVAAGDVDNDGDLDAIFGGMLMKNNGHGYYYYAQYIEGLEAVALGDLDADGDLDVFLGRQGDAPDVNCSVWMNDGSGLFVFASQPLCGGSNWDFALGDLDGDGDLDVFLAKGTGGTAGVPNQVWLNDGSGSFTDSGQRLGNLDSRSIQLGDLDLDGDLDAFIANQFAEGNEVRFNDSTGIFTNSGQSLGKDTNDDSVTSAIGDVDHDGDLDALVGNNMGQIDKIWLNDGSGFFGNSGEAIAGTADTEAVALGDLDGDGDLDALIGINGFIGNPLGNQIWLNDGAGHFIDSQQVLGSSRHRPDRPGRC